MAKGKQGVRSMADAGVTEFDKKGPGYAYKKKSDGEYVGPDIDADSHTQGWKLGRDKPPRRGGGKAVSKGKRGARGPSGGGKKKM